MMLRQPPKKLIQTANKRGWFQQCVRTADGIGGFTQSWENFLPRFVAIQPIRAQQVMDYRSVGVDASHVIKSRGYLSLPTNTKKVGETWSVSWSGLAGSTVKIEYSVNSADFVEISASESNTGSYNWTVATGAKGEKVYIRVTDNEDATSYSDTEKYLILSSDIVSRDINESDRFLWGSRVFEILTIEDIQEKNFTKLITCKERR